MTKEIGRLFHLPEIKEKPASKAGRSLWQKLFPFWTGRYVPGVGMTSSRFVLGIRKSAIAETLIFLILALIVDVVFCSGNRFADFSPQPFSLIVLLITVQYGVAEGLMCALLSSLFLLVGNIPEQDLSQTIYDHIYHIIFWPFIWFTGAIILGQISQRHINAKREAEHQVSLVEKREDTISTAYNSLKEIKEMLESRIASQMRSTVRAYDAIKDIEGLNQSRILMGVEQVVVASMIPAKFSIYT